MAVRAYHDYSDITTEWFLGDEDELDLWKQPINAFAGEFDPQKARLLLGYMQCGLTMRQAAEEVPMEFRWCIAWRRGAHGTPDNFRVAFEIAREVQIHCMADEVIDIADGTDYQSRAKLKASIDSQNIFRKNLSEEVQKSISSITSARGDRIGTRKWYVSKILPKYYGDRMQLDHGNVGVTLKKINMKDLTDEQLDKLLELDEELRNGTSD